MRNIELNNKIQKDTLTLKSYLRNASSMMNTLIIDLVTQTLRNFKLDYLVRDIQDLQLT